MTPDDLEVAHAGDRGRETIGDGLHLLHGNGRARVQRAPHRVRAGGLDPDDARTRAFRGDRDRDAGDQTAAADAHDEQIRLRQVVEHLQRARPVAGDHPVVVVRVKKVGALTLL